MKRKRMKSKEEGDGEFLRRTSLELGLHVGLSAGKVDLVDVKEKPAAVRQIEDMMTTTPLKMVSGTQESTKL